MPQGLLPGGSNGLARFRPQTIRKLLDAIDANRQTGDRRDDDAELQRLIDRGSQSGRVLVKNVSDRTVRTGEVLGVTRLMIAFDENSSAWADADLSYHGRTPRVSQDAIVIAESPILPGQSGQCIDSGACLVKVQQRNPAHQFAKPMPGRGQNLVSCYDGPVRIVGWSTTRLNHPDSGELFEDLGDVFDPPVAEPADQHPPIYWARGILLPDREHGHRQSGLRMAYVAQSVTAAVVWDRDLDDDDETDDAEDPDIVIDDELIPGRGTVTFWEFGPSQYDRYQFPITGFVEVDGEPVLNRPIIDASGSAFPLAKLQRLLDETALPADSRVFVQGSSTLDAAGRRVTSNDGYYYLTAAADFDDDTQLLTLTLDRDLLPLPDVLDGDDPETLGSIALETWQPARKYTDGNGNLVAETEPVWNTYEDESITTGTPLDICRQQNRNVAKMPACAVSALDLTPDVDL